MATPFRDDESVDLESFSHAVQFMKNAGVDGVTIVGVLGESNRLLDHERDRLVETAVHAADGMPVIVGTSHPGTRATAELSKRAEDLGASGVMVTPTREPTPLLDQRLLEYFQVVDSAISIPIVLQDHPASTQVHMPVQTLGMLVREVPGITCVKLESLPSPPRITLLKDMMNRNGRSATILTGLGALYGAFDLMAESDGFMTGFAFPEVLKAMVTSASDHEGMFSIYKHWLPMMVFEQQPGLAVRKEIYRFRGLIQSGHVRHPGANIGEGAQLTLEMLMRDAVGDNWRDAIAGPLQV